jgi:AcrR family transcriptional regulator
MKNSTALITRDIHVEIIGQRSACSTTTALKRRLELRMSPSNIYRFFMSKAEINAAVCGRLFDEIEATAEEIARSSGPASKTLRNLIASVESRNSLRSLNDPKLHELFQTAYDENWPMVHEHSKRMDRILEEVIRQGMAAGEFRADDAALAAIRFVRACIRSCDPQLMVECAHDPEPTTDQMVDFCLAALA